MTVPEHSKFLPSSDQSDRLAESAARSPSAPLRCEIATIVLTHMTAIVHRIERFWMVARRIRNRRLFRNRFLITGITMIPLTGDIRLDAAIECGKMVNSAAG